MNFAFKSMIFNANVQVDSVVGVRSRDEDPIQWTDKSVCPGGITKHTRICPLEKLWLGESK